MGKGMEIQNSLMGMLFKYEGGGEMDNLGQIQKVFLFHQEARPPFEATSPYDHGFGITGYPSDPLIYEFPFQKVTHTEVTPQQPANELTPPWVWAPLASNSVLAAKSFHRFRACACSARTTVHLSLSYSCL